MKSVKNKIFNRICANCLEENENFNHILTIENFTFLVHLYNITEYNIYKYSLHLVSHDINKCTFVHLHICRVHKE